MDISRAMAIPRIDSKGVTTIKIIILDKYETQESTKKYSLQLISTKLI
ncbi:MAG TPA: hypothetical protein VJU85_04370 [Nitrososphaeraceae archaeon]|nr:hypothetical protein [Nitrososphaeraceae archaeon]